MMVDDPSTLATIRAAVSAIGRSALTDAFGAYGPHGANAKPIDMVVAETTGESLINNIPTDGANRLTACVCLLHDDPTANTFYTYEDMYAHGENEHGMDNKTTPNASQGVKVKAKEALPIVLGLDPTRSWIWPHPDDPAIPWVLETQARARQDSYGGVNL